MKIKFIQKIIDKIRGKKFSSGRYWEERYKKGGNSGAGSYNNLAEFKAEIINKFVVDNDIETIIEFGCGDGNQLALFDFKHYIGFDVSDSILNQIREKYKDNKNYSFQKMCDFCEQRAELVLSLDVIYHLVEDVVFEQYMNDLFKASKRYVIIYASNKDEIQCAHVKHRKFSDYIENNFNDWEMIKFIPNKYPFDKNNPDYTSFADFYIYKKL